MLPQSIFGVDSELFTVPLPPPSLVTVSLYDVNVAVTDFAEDTVSVQVLVPVQSSPDQPVKVELSESGVAVRVTLVPLSYVTVPVLPLHVIVPVLAVTVPVPVPDFVMVRV